MGLYLSWGFINSRLKADLDLNLLLFIFMICDYFSQILKVKWINKCHSYLITKKSRFQSLLIYSLPISKCQSSYWKMPKLARVGLYSSWGYIVSLLIFDWGCITFWLGWGSIQEWGCICAVDFLLQKLTYGAFFLLKFCQSILILIQYW